MKNVLGCINSSPWNFMDTVSTWCRDNGHKVVIAEENTPLARGDIYVFSSIATLQSHAGAVQDRRGVVVIFDTPLALAEIKGIRYLDSDKPNLSYMFKLKPLNVDAVKDLFNKKKLPKIQLKSKKIDLIPKLIDRVRRGRFLDKFSTLTYNTSNLRTRTIVQYNILNYLFKQSTKDEGLVELQKFLKSRYRRSPAAGEAVKNMLDFLATKEGKDFCKAVVLVGASQDKKKPINYKKIAKDHSVDKFELKFLAKLWKKTQLEYNFNPINLAEHKLKHKNKKPVES